MTTDFSMLQEIARKHDIEVVMTRCRKLARLPGVIMVPVWMTQAEADRLAGEMQERRTA